MHDLRRLRPGLPGPDRLRPGRPHRPATEPRDDGVRVPAGGHDRLQGHGGAGQPLGRGPGPPHGVGGGARRPRPGGPGRARGRVPALGRLRRVHRPAGPKDQPGARSHPEGREGGLRHAGSRGEVHGRPGAPDGQRVPVRPARAGEHRDLQAVPVPEDPRHLPALPEQPRQGLPGVRDELHRRAPLAAPRGAAGRRPRAARPREGNGGARHLPRPLLPRPLQRHRRAPARGAGAPRGEDGGDGEEPEERLLLRRRRRPHLPRGDDREAGERRADRAGPRHRRDGRSRWGARSA